MVRRINAFDELRRDLANGEAIDLDVALKLPVCGCPSQIADPPCSGWGKVEEVDDGGIERLCSVLHTSHEDVGGRQVAMRSTEVMQGDHGQAKLLDDLGHSEDVWRRPAGQGIAVYVTSDYIRPDLRKARGLHHRQSMDRTRHQSCRRLKQRQHRQVQSLRCSAADAGPQLHVDTLKRRDWRRSRSVRRPFGSISLART